MTHRPYDDMSAGMALGPIEALSGEPRPVGVLDPNDPDHVGAIGAATRIGLDLETDGFFAYQERVCLMQLATPDGDWFFDPLESPGRLPEPLVVELARDDRAIVGHALENDIRSLKRDFGLGLGRIFDTALAARLDPEPLPLGLKDLLEVVLGVRIDKGEQRSDWARRPLALEQLGYARQDVTHLLALADAMEERLETSGRRAWHAEECGRTLELEPTEKRFDSEGWRKLGGATKLGKRGRAVLAELWEWREARAEAENRAPFRVLAPELLGRIASVADARGPDTLKQLPRMGFLPSSLDRNALAAVIEAGLGRPDPGPRRPSRPAADSRAPLDEGAKARLQRLKDGRTRWAAQLGIDPGFLLSNTVLERIARMAPPDREALADVTGVGRWRSEQLHAEILDALRL